MACRALLQGGEGQARPAAPVYGRNFKQALMASLMKKRKRRWNWLRYRKDDLAHNVQVAVQRWVHANGGTAAIMSGVQLMYFPGEGEANYRIAIHCTGIRPVKKEKADGEVRR